MEGDVTTDIYLNFLPRTEFTQIVFGTVLLEVIILVGEIF